MIFLILSTFSYNLSSLISCFFLSYPLATPTPPQHGIKLFITDPKVPPRLNADIPTNMNPNNTSNTIARYYYYIMFIILFNSNNI